MMTLAVYFDVDETLVRSSTSVQSLYERSCNELGVPVDLDACETFYDRFFVHLGTSGTDPYIAAAEDMAEQHSLSIDVGRFVAEYTQSEVTSTTVPKSVKDTVARLHTKATIGVITNGVADVQRRKLVHHQLSEYVDEFFAASETSAPKPDAKMFELATTATDASRYVYVGDSVPKDVLPAKQAGFETVLVGDTKADLPDLVIPEHSTFEDLVAYLDQDEG